MMFEENRACIYMSMRFDCQRYRTLTWYFTLTVPELRRHATALTSKESVSRRLHNVSDTDGTLGARLDGCKYSCGCCSCCYSRPIGANLPSNYKVAP